MSFYFLGCKIKIKFYFVALASIMILLDKSGKIGFGLIFAVIHEIGHLCAMYLKKCPPTEITAGLFDVNIKDSCVNTRTYKDDVVIYFFGPLFNLLLTVIFYILYRIYYDENFLISASENLAIFAFNILPVENLDGGQILFSLLAPRYGIKLAIHIVEIISLIVLFPIAILGFYTLTVSRYNFSLLLFSLYLIAMLFIKKADIKFKKQ